MWARQEGAGVRVVMLSKALVVGSYQTKLEAIAAYDDVALTALVPPLWREGRRRTVLERAHLQGYDLRELPICLNGSFHAHFYPTLRRELRRLGPDLVHIDEEPYNLATYLAVRACRAEGARCLFFTWQNLLRRYPWPFGAMERSVYGGVDAAIAGNAAAVDVLRAKGYAGPATVIPQFGVDPGLFRPSGGRPPSSRVVIGYAGRLVPEKGLWLLIEALEQLAGDWELRLIGQGPLEGALRDRVARSRLAQRVVFYGQAGSGEMPQRLAELDILALPSLTQANWAEQFGRVLVEAMACEVAVVGSDSGEIPQVIGDAGLVVREGDAMALRDGLQRLIDEPELRRSLGSRGRQRVLDHYTQARIAAETVAVYRRVLGADGHESRG
jgi:glycosyltransferase involved in cell wall biosynthesis